MKQIAQQVLRYAGLTALTVVACGVMYWVSSRDVSVATRGKAGTAPPPAAAAPKARVAAMDVRPELAELTVKYTGKVQPWESYSLGFEIGGRVQQLGVDSAGKPLDMGAKVTTGQVLARLDDRILRARKSEAVAQLEQAASDLSRARNLRQRGGKQAITDAEYQEFLTAFALAKAQQEVATKSLEDATIVSPVDGAIAHRWIEAGESVNPHAVVFEVVENQDVLLVVDVPESRVRELELRMRAVREARARGDSDPESTAFRARVQMEGRDVFGKRWPRIDAEVYRIAQLADERTGLFEVEVRIPNGEGLLRPGMVASAEIVTDRLLAYKIPENAIIFRGRDAFLYHLKPQPSTVKAMFWEVGQTELQKAERIDLQQWVDQGDVVLAPAASIDLGPLVVRGQQRLTDGQLVRVTNPSQTSGEMTAQRTSGGGVN
ncbi:MAG: efflux RND transporter periplasmic adaptor subunit [Planctomycetota bacterium]